LDLLLSIYSSFFLGSWVKANPDPSRSCKSPIPMPTLTLYGVGAVAERETHRLLGPILTYFGNLRLPTEGQNGRFLKRFGTEAGWAPGG